MSPAQLSLVLRSAQQGNAAAIAKLQGEALSVGRRMVGQLLGQAEAVEDLASSLNEAVHHSLHRLESGDRLRTFMFGCAATYGYSALQEPTTRVRNCLGASGPIRLRPSAFSERKVVHAPNQLRADR